MVDENRFVKRNVMCKLCNPYVTVPNINFIIKCKILHSPKY